MRPGDRGVLILVALGAVVWMLLPMLTPSELSGSSIAVVMVDGKELLRIDLGQVSGEEEIEIDTYGGGRNVLRVQHNRIRVIEANCPDQIDVRQGWISRPYESIVCVPNRMVILLEAAGDREVDIVSQ